MWFDTRRAAVRVAACIGPDVLVEVDAIDVTVTMTEDVVFHVRRVRGRLPLLAALEQPFARNDVRVECPFCDALTEEGSASQVISDRFPVSPGHVLVIPRRHVERVEELDDREWVELFAVVRKEVLRVSAEPGVDGVNIGVNSGTAAGQTVGHAHVHLIPRRCGDVPDPRGGVRWVIPDRADYWTRR